MTMGEMGQDERRYSGYIMNVNKALYYRESYKGIIRSLSIKVSGVWYRVYPGSGDITTSSLFSVQDLDIVIKDRPHPDDVAS